MDSHDNHGNGHGHGHGHGHQTRFGYPQRPSINFYFAKEKWVDPLKDPYHGLRFDIKNPTRKFLSRLGWCYGVFTGAFITYIALSNLPLYTYPVCIFFILSIYFDQNLILYLACTSMAQRTKRS